MQSASGSADCVKLLIHQYGCNVDEVEITTRRTALHLAAITRHFDVANCLIQVSLYLYISVSVCLSVCLSAYLSLSVFVPVVVLWLVSVSVRPNFLEGRGSKPSCLKNIPTAPQKATCLTWPPSSMLSTNWNSVLRQATAFQRLLLAGRNKSIFRLINTQKNYSCILYFWLMASTQKFTDCLKKLLYASKSPGSYMIVCLTWRKSW